MNAKKSIQALTAAVVASVLFAGEAVAIPVFWDFEDHSVPSGWASEGYSGVLPYGISNLDPQGGNRYGYVVTNGANGQNVSWMRSDVFPVNAGDNLQLSFNYLTSDGRKFNDFAEIRLVNPADDKVLTLVNARTTERGVDVGFLEGVALDGPPFTAGPSGWLQLGSDRNACYGTNDSCGATGWWQLDYTFDSAGEFSLAFYVGNVLDDLYQSGLAFDDISIASRDVPGSVPEPASLALLGIGLIGVAVLRRCK